jgi:hypothetical protein
VQRYVRVALYYLFGSLATYGVTVPDSKKTLIISVVGVVANLIWTAYGTKLSALLTEIQKKGGVSAVNVTVDPAVIDAPQLSSDTPQTVTVKIK